MPFWLINVQSLFLFNTLLVLFNWDSSLQCLVRGLELCGDAAMRWNKTQSLKQQRYEHKWAACGRHRSSWVRLPCLIAISYCYLQLFVASQKEDCLVSEAVMTFVCCCCDYVCFMWKFLHPLCDAPTSNFCFPCGSAVSHFLSFSFPPPFFVSW